MDIEVKEEEVIHLSKLTFVFEFYTIQLTKILVLSSRYHYSGYPREATSYPVFEEDRGRGFEGRYERGGYRGRGRYDNHGGRGGGR